VHFHASTSVPEDSTLQKLIRVATKTAEPFQFDLKVERVALFSLAVSHVVAPEQANCHAATFPLHTAECFQTGAVGQRIVPAPHQTPAFGDRNQGCGIDLFDRIAGSATEPIGEVGNASFAEAVLSTNRTQLSLLDIAIPLGGEAAAKSIGQVELDIRDVGEPSSTLGAASGSSWTRCGSK
jgi:hypothetical protein